MTDELLKVAASNGVFAVLFVSLFLYVLKENAKREQNYQDIIKKLSGVIDEKMRCIETKIDELRSCKHE